MNNNDVIRRLRYTFELSDTDMIEVFELANYETTRAEISDWLKKDDDEAQQLLDDIHLAIFLNGFINKKRGKKEGPQPVPEHELTNNNILRKLKIALNLKDEGLLEIFRIAGFKLSKHELSAFFRKPGHSHYRICKDQFLRNFLQGLQITYRPEITSQE